MSNKTESIKERRCKASLSVSWSFSIYLSVIILSAHLRLLYIYVWLNCVSLTYLLSVFYRSISTTPSCLYSICLLTSLFSIYLSTYCVSIYHLSIYPASIYHWCKEHCMKPQNREGRFSTQHPRGMEVHFLLSFSLFSFDLSSLLVSLSLPLHLCIYPSLRLSSYLSVYLTLKAILSASI